MHKINFNFKFTDSKVLLFRFYYDTGLKCEHIFLYQIIKINLFSFSILSLYLKVPERYMQCLRISSSVKGKLLPNLHLLTEGSEQCRRRGANESRDKNSPSTNANGILGGRMSR